jgi:hypothetical protein
LSNLPKEFSDLEQLRDHIRHWLCNDWATILIGSTLSGAVAKPAITKSPQAYCSAGQDPDVNVRFELTRDCNWLKGQTSQQSIQTDCCRSEWRSENQLIATFFTFFAPPPSI